LARASEPFRANEGDDEIGRKGDGDGKTDQGFEHRGLLETAERARIKRKHDKAADAGGKEKNIGHANSPDC
jgi:hypothetical protein